jgi:purine-binding chemotaxis protein CheW
MADVQPEQQATQYLSFTVAGGDYGLPILKVREILSYEGSTPVPGTPPSIRGVVNVRGAVVPVVDLALKFGKAATETTNRTCVLVVDAVSGTESITVGLLAAAVNEVIELGARDVEPPPAFGTGVRVDYLLGLGKAGTGFVLLLDLDRVLSASEAELAAQAAAATQAAATQAAAAQAAGEPAAPAAR